MFYLIQQTINDLKIHDNNGINGNRDLEDFSGTQKNSGVTLLLSRVFFPFGLF